MFSAVLAQADAERQEALIRVAIQVAVVLAAASVLLALVWFLVRRMTKPVESTPNELLTDFRSLKEQGELTDEEYRRVRMVLDNKIRRQAGMTPVETEKLPPLNDEDADSKDDFEWKEVDLTALDPDGPQKPPNQNE